MSDLEPPPAKVSKLEISGTTENPLADEEWLSEGVLTDEDYNSMSLEKTDITDGNSSQSVALSNINEDSTAQDLQIDTNIEIHLNSLGQVLTESEKEHINTEFEINVEISKESEINEDIKHTVDEKFPIKADDENKNLNLLKEESVENEKDKFLDAITTTKDVDSLDEKDMKHEESDGNDTDELLRMLSEEPKSKNEDEKKNNVKKRLSISEPDTKSDRSSDFNLSKDAVHNKDFSSNKRGVNSKTFKSMIQSQSLIIRRHTDSTSESEEDSLLMERKSQSIKKITSLERNSTDTYTKSGSDSSKNMKDKKNTKSVLRKHSDSPKTKSASKTFSPRSNPSKLNGKRNVRVIGVKDIFKPSQLPKTKTQEPKKSDVNLSVQSKQKDIKKVHQKIEKSHVKSSNTSDEENMESLNEEYLDDTEMSSDDDRFERKHPKPHVSETSTEDDMQDITDSEDDSEFGLYDGLVSSDSDVEEWFVLDIRAEKAGEYIPLLGPLAHQLLLEERDRVTVKLKDLRESFTRLSKQTKLQLQELDAAAKRIRDLNRHLKDA